MRTVCNAIVHRFTPNNKKKIMKTVCINLLVSVTQCPQVLPLLTSISNLNVGSWNLLSSEN